MLETINVPYSHRYSELSFIALPCIPEDKAFFYECLPLTKEPKSSNRRASDLGNAARATEDMQTENSSDIESHPKRTTI
ncbi:hypothetical protein MBANPS3_012022 [Mucor bainieri]